MRLGRQVSLLCLVVLAGCGPAGASSATPAAPTGGAYQLTCGPVPPNDCVAWANDIVANAHTQNPGRMVVSVTFTGADGDYELIFDDGTGAGADIN